MAEDDATEWAGEEAGPEGDEREEGRDTAREFVREEDLAEHQRGGRAVDVEVVPLDGGADEGGDTGLAGLPRDLLIGGCGRTHAPSVCYAPGTRRVECGLRLNREWQARLSSPIPNRTRIDTAEVLLGSPCSSW